MMPFRTVERLAKVTSSVTLAIDAKAKALKASGVDVCNFTVGEPDFETPVHIRDAAKKALDLGKTKYGAASGELALKKAIVEKLKKDNGLHYEPENIMVSNGGKQTIFNCILASIQPGDEVIIPAPYWLSYPEMVRLAGGTPVVLPTTVETRFKITAEQLRAAVTPRTRLLILNSPSNPTGMIYSRAELQAIAQVVVDCDFRVLSDEIYEKLVYDGEHVSIGSLGSEIFSRSILSNGFAKAYAMTGWRVGYLAGAKEIIKSCTTIQSHSTSNVCTFAQYGAIAAIEGPDDCVRKMRQTFIERRQTAVELMQKIPSITCAKPDGAFYLFFDIRKTGLSSLQFCERFLEEQKVATVPGVAFGDDNHVRISYAADLETIRKGMQRLDAFVRSLT